MLEKVIQGKFCFRGRAPIASMDAMEDMEVNNGSNTVLAPDCQVNNLFTASRSVTLGVPE